MDASGETEPPTPERAGLADRLFAVALGSATAGLGAYSPWFVPDTCRWVGWLALALFVPVGLLTVLLGLRGRADIRDFGINFVREVGVQGIGGVVVLAALGLWAVLR